MTGYVVAFLLGVAAGVLLAIGFSCIACAGIMSRREEQEEDGDEAQICEKTNRC